MALRTGIAPPVLLGMTPQQWSDDPQLVDDVFRELHRRLMAEDRKK